LPRGPGSIGSGQIQSIYGNVDIYIPAGGTAADALLFVSDDGAKEVKVYNVNNGTLVRSIVGNGKGSGTGQFDSPMDVFIANTGPQSDSELFVSDDCNDVVMVFNPMTGAYIRSIGNGKGAGAGQFNGPWGLLVQTPLVSGGDYLLYVTDVSNHRVQVFNAVTGAHLRCIGAGNGAGQGQLSNPYGGAVLCPVQHYREGATLDLFVSEYSNNRISVFDSTTGAFIRHIGVGQLSHPWGLALSLGGVDSQGGDYLLYVCEDGNNRVQIFNVRTGSHVGIVGVGPLKNPRGLKLFAGSDGKTLLFVSDHANKRVEVLEV
jgi:DNA-binding beta-propeller fold protein YncE